MLCATLAVGGRARGQCSMNPAQWVANLDGMYVPSHVTSDAAFNPIRKLNYVVVGKELRAYDAPVTGVASLRWTITMGASFNTTPTPVPLP